MIKMKYCIIKSQIEYDNDNYCIIQQLQIQYDDDESKFILNPDPLLIQVQSTLLSGVILILY